MACDANDVEEPAEIEVEVQEDLAGTIWQWKSFKVNRRLHPIEFGHTSDYLPEHQYLLFFRDPYGSQGQQIWGLDGTLDCNRVGAGYVYKTGGTLSFYNVTTTAMGCGGGIEGLFLEALVGAKRYETQQDTLRIYGDGDTFLGGRPVVLYFVRTTFPAQLR